MDQIIIDDSNDYDDESIISSQSTLIAIIKLEDDEWVLKDVNTAKGETFKSSSEELFISSLSHIDELGIYFTLASSSECIGYYHRDNEIICETANFWFGCGIPEEGDTITLYPCEVDDWYNYQDIMTDEEGVSEDFPLLVELRYNGSNWVVVQGDFTPAQPIGGFELFDLYLADQLKEDMLDFDIDLENSTVSVTITNPSAYTLYNIEQNRLWIGLDVYQCHQHGALNTVNPNMACNNGYVRTRYHKY